MAAVSIITPLLNKAPYISETIRSVREQTFGDWEMLIVDNGSTDGSQDIVRRCDDARIRLFETDGAGPGAARNLGLREAHGEWIQFLDADDLLEPDHLAAQLEVAGKNPEAGIIAGSWQEFPDGQPDQRVKQRPTGLDGGRVALRDAAIAFAPWAVHAALVRRELFTPDLQWPEELDRLLAEDIAFWFRLVDSCEVAFSPTEGALYRRMSPNCRTNLKPENWYRGVHAAICSNLEFLRRHNQDLTAGQCENLMQVYSVIHEMAVQARSDEIQVKSLEAARHWLGEYFRRGGKASLPMTARRMLGLKTFLGLSRLVSRRKPDLVTP